MLMAMSIILHEDRSFRRGYFRLHPLECRERKVDVSLLSLACLRTGRLQTTDHQTLKRLNMYLKRTKYSPCLRF